MTREVVADHVEVAHGIRGGERFEQLPVPGRVARRRGERERLSSRTRSAPNTQDRKSTRLNSSHANISYAVFCLKKKKNNQLSVLLDFTDFLLRATQHLAYDSYQSDDSH